MGRDDWDTFYFTDLDRRAKSLGGKVRVSYTRWIMCRPTDDKPHQDWLYPVTVVLNRQLLEPNRISAKLPGNAS